MYKVHDFLVYKRDVCEILEIKKNHIQDKDYYVLCPVRDSSLHLEIPIDVSNCPVRPLISKEEIMELIQKIPSIPIIDCEDKMLENNYKSLYKTGEFDDLIQIIKTTYLRNKDRLERHKKISDTDQQYLEKAEQALYVEIGLVLGKNFDETKEYMFQQVLKASELQG